MSTFLWPDITFYGLDEWFWAMFELTWTWLNLTFGHLFRWIGANNDQIWLPMDQTSDSEQYLNRLQLYLISLLVKFWSCEFGKYDMTRYDFSMDEPSDSKQCSNWLKFDLISLLVKFSSEFEQIMTRYDLLGARRVILSNVQTDSNLTKFWFCQLLMWIGANRWIFWEKSPKWGFKFN